MKINGFQPRPHGSVGWSIVLSTEGLLVQFLVRAHASVAGSIPGWGTYGRQPIDVSFTLMFLSLSPYSLSLPTFLFLFLKSMEICPQVKIFLICKWISVYTYLNKMLNKKAGHRGTQTVYSIYIKFKHKRENETIYYLGIQIYLV